MTSDAENSTPVDPLESLLIDAQEVNRAQIADALRSFVAVDSSSGAVVFRPASRRLDAQQKVLVYLLGRKVSRLLERLEIEGAQPKVIIADTGMASGTVHPTLKQLRESRMVSQDDGGGYFVAVHQIQDALDAIKSEGE